MKRFLNSRTLVRSRRRHNRQRGTLAIVGLGEIGTVVLLIGVLLSVLAVVGLVDVGTVVRDDSAAGAAASQSAPASPVYGMAVAHTPGIAALCRLGARAEVCNLRTGERLDSSHLPAFDPGNAEAVALSADGRLLGIGRTDGSILFRLEEPPVVRDFVLTGHEQPVDSLQFSTDGLIAASSSSDGAVRIWDVAAGRLLRALQFDNSPGDARTYLVFSPDARFVVAASQSGRLAWWRTDNGHPLGCFSISPGVRGIALSPDGETLVICNVRWRDVRRLDLRSGQELWRTTHSDGGNMYTSIAISPDGRSVTAGDSFGGIHAFDAVTGQPLKSFKAHRASVMCLQYSPDGTVLYSASHDGKIGAWQAAELQSVSAGVGEADSRLESILQMCSQRSSRVTFGSCRTKSGPKAVEGV